MGRGLLIETGWVGAVAVMALCTLMFLFTSVAFQGADRTDRVTKLPSLQEGRVALPPPGRDAPSPTSARPTPSGPGGGRDGR